MGATLHSRTPLRTPNADVPPLVIRSSRFDSVPQRLFQPGTNTFTTVLGKPRKTQSASSENWWSCSIHLCDGSRECVTSCENFLFVENLRELFASERVEIRCKVEISCWALQIILICVGKCEIRWWKLRLKITIERRKVSPFASSAESVRNVQKWKNQSALSLAGRKRRFSSLESGGKTQGKLCRRRKSRVFFAPPSVPTLVLYESGHVLPWPAPRLRRPRRHPAVAPQIPPVKKRYGWVPKWDWFLGTREIVQHQQWRRSYDLRHGRWSVGGPSF